MNKPITDVFHSEREYYEALLFCVKQILEAYVEEAVEADINGVLKQVGGRVLYKSDLQGLLHTYEKEDVNQKRYVLLEELRRIRRKGQLTMRHGVVISMEYLLRAFGLSDFEAYMFILTWACEVDHDLGLLFSFLNEKNSLYTPSIRVCIRTYASDWREEMALQQSCIDRWRFLSWLFVGMYERCRSLEQGNAEGALEMGLKLDHRMVAYLQDYNSYDPLLEDFIQYDYSDDTEIWIHQEVANGLKRLHEEEEEPTLYYLQGEYGCGKKHQIVSFCQSRRQDVLLVDSGKLFNSSYKLELLIFRLMRESILRGSAAICFVDMEAEVGDDYVSKEAMEQILWNMRAWNQSFYITSTHPWNGKIRNLGRPVCKILIPQTTTDERIILWKNFLDGVAVPDDLNLEFLADKYILSAGAIRHSVEDYQAQMRMELSEPKMKWLLEACRHQLDHRLGNDAIYIPAKYEWDDLILPEPQKKMLRDACDQVMYHHLVYHKWGFEKKLAYGKGVSMIFYGPPGTGKTMGAQVIANELDMELYKVDMAGVMSKYVGESEKKLGNIFEQARRSQSILFFDEADVLFGKRTDQKDSNDKYANASTAYLLQKIEEYEGIIILATNLLQNFDNAFLRRFKFIIEFPFTDKDRRLEIWQNVFPENTPKEELDLEYLAEEFHFSGSQIKNVAVAAAFLAAGEHVPVNMRHILTAVKREMSKIGKTLIASDFGPYYYLMEGEN